MAREYMLAGQNGSVTNASNVSWVYIQPPTAAGNNSALEVLRMFASQRANATSNQQGIQFSSQPTSFPTLTSVAPSKLKQNDPSSLIAGATTGAAGTGGVFASAEGTGAKTVFWQDAFNVLNGWLWVPTPPETLVLPPNPSTAVGYALGAPSAPTTLTNWNAGIVFREIG